MKTPWQQWPYLLAEAEALKPPPIQVPPKFLDELNQYGEIRSRDEFLELVAGAGGALAPFRAR